LPKKQTQEEVLADFKAIHGDRYDYSEVIYVKSKNKVKIKCLVDGHGIFEQIVADHKTGSGCKKCGKIIMSEKSKKNSQLKKRKVEDILSRFYRIHGNEFDYSNMKYVKNKIPIEIICKFHKSFFMTPLNHDSGQKCPKCSGKNLTNEENIKEFEKQHGKLYDYSLVECLDYETPVNIICSIHGIFPQLIYNHKNGAGCHQCADTGFNKKKKGILYYVRINKDGKELYKVGITNLTVKKRFRSQFKYITIIRQYEYDSGQEAYDMEQQILKDYSYAKYNGDKILKSGNTEMFKYDILGWDN